MRQIFRALPLLLWLACVGTVEAQVQEDKYPVRVVDEDGDPMKDAVILIKSEHRGMLLHGQAKTDASGKAIVKIMHFHGRASSVVLVAQAKRRASTVLGLDGPSDDGRETKVVLKKGTRVVKGVGIQSHET